MIAIVWRNATRDAKSGTDAVFRSTTTYTAVRVIIGL